MIISTTNRRGKREVGLYLTDQFVPWSQFKKKNSQIQLSSSLLDPIIITADLRETHTNGGGHLKRIHIGAESFLNSYSILNYHVIFFF